jgi:hypothetical protein
MTIMTIMTTTIIVCVTLFVYVMRFTTVTTAGAK